MYRKHTWFGEQAFGDGADSRFALEIDSHRRATDYLQNTLSTNGGVAVLRGPSGSGKHSVVSRYHSRISKKSACAIVDGSKLQPNSLLATVMRGFGHITDLKSVGEHLHMVNVIAVQQVRICQPPTLIVENIDQMFPSALRVLSVLAAFSVREQFAIRIVLTSECDVTSIMSAVGMVDIASRVEKIHDIEPMSSIESMKHLHGRLEACGVRNPDSVFPIDVCDRLHESSQGWPGQLNRSAMAAIERAVSFPVKVADTREEYTENTPQPELPATTDFGAVKHSSPPQLVVSRHGKQPIEIAFQNDKMLIGRSALADVVLEDRFVSNAHALLILFSEALLLLDLNSKNGTYVNSVWTRTAVLQSNDTISLGHYRIKVQNAPDWDDDAAHYEELVNTTRMKNLQDMRLIKRGNAEWPVERRKRNA